MILVTGGTGLVGAHLLYHLLQEHPRVRATHRASSDIPYVKEIFRFYTEDPDEAFQRIEWREANITRLPELSEVFEGITHVFHCAAFISFNPKHYKALKKANVEGTANVVNLCLFNGVKKLCYVSSVATLGDSENNEPINESVLWNPEAKNSVYSITKYGAEMEVWRGTQEGLDAVIVNPGVILGEGFWNSGSGVIIRQAAQGISYFTDGSTGFVDIRDVVKVLVLLMKSKVSKERFILVAENKTYKALIGQLNVLFSKPEAKRQISRNLLYALSTIDALSNRLFGTKRIVLKATVRSLFTHSSYDSGKIKSALDFEFIPLDETLERVVSAYLNPSSVLPAE